MKKIKLTAVFVMLLQLTFAGGLLTNYNQSAQYIRMLSRNASVDIDAVFYNPAGLVKMENGWHFALYSQTIFQDRDISTGFPTLNKSDYEGKTTIPIFPDFYAVYKKNKWAYSIGVGPIGGGGTAKFKKGMPTLEIPFSLIPSQLAALGQIDPGLAVNSYSLDMGLEASSTFWGIQLGASYAVNDKFSFYGGLRLLPSSNEYEGAIRNIQLNGVNAASWLNGASAQVGEVADMATAGAGQYASAAATAGALSTQIADAISAGLVSGSDPLNDPQLIGALQQFGIDPTNFTYQIAAGAFSQTSSALSEEAQNLTATAQTLNGTAQTLTGTAGQVGDREVKTKQKGMGFTPIIGFNYSPSDDWTFALKYEFETKLTLENETDIDQLGMFPDGAKTSSDIPAIFTAGVGFRGIDWLEVQLSYNMYFDKGVDYGNNVRYSTLGQQVHRDIDNNHWELGLGLQFNVSDNFAFSLGGLRSKKGVTPQYQSDFSFSNSSYTIGGGIEWKITDKLTFDAGMSNSFYKNNTVTFTHPGIGSYDETYEKSSISIAAGLSYSIF